MKKQVLVINYHRVDTGLTPGLPAIDKIFAVRRTDFERHIQTLVDHNIPVVSCADMVDGNIPASFSVAITVDDGNDSDFGIVYPLLKANGMTATFFLLAGKEGFLDRQQLREIIDNGFSVGSHGITHRELTKLNPQELKHDLEFSKKILEDITEQPVDFFSFPYGINNKKTIRQAKNAGYKAVFTTDARLNYPDEKLFVIHRWSVKRSTSPGEFEAILTNKKALQKLILKSKIRKMAFMFLGRLLADRLNIFIHSGTQSID